MKENEGKRRKMKENEGKRRKTKENERKIAEAKLDSLDRRKTLLRPNGPARRKQGFTGDCRGRRDRIGRIGGSGFAQAVRTG